MNKIIDFIKCISLIFISLLVISCGEDIINESSSQPSVGSEGQADTDGFWVRLDNEFIPSYTKKEGVWADGCFISADTLSSEIISCIIDVNEGDMYMTDLEIKYNAPPDLCKHVSTSVPWHWNYSSGTGPKKVTVALDKSGETDVLGAFDSTGTGCNVTLEDNSVVACNAADEFKELTSTFEPKCIYDYSSDTVRPNCCFGEYIYEVLVDDDGNGTQDSATSETKVWGGEVNECIGGMGKQDWEFYSKEGYPIRKVKPVSDGEGLTEVLTIKSNGSTARSSFSFPATFYETTGDPHNHDGYETATTSNQPYAVNPIDDLDGSSVIAGNGNMIFTCLDEAFEVKHQISVSIREWNTNDEFAVYGTSGGVIYDPDVIGTEGVDCESIFGTSCNDFLDFKDILTGAGSAYTTDNTVLNPNAVRETYFPNVPY